MVSGSLKLIFNLLTVLLVKLCISVQCIISWYHQSSAVVQIKNKVHRNLVTSLTGY